MALTFNPITGQFDFKGGSTGGGGASLAERYTKLFNNTSDWTISGQEYFQTITAGTHAKGTTPNVMAFESVGGGSYEQVNLTIAINGSGDVTLKVSAVPDNRFTGLVVII